MNRIAIVTALAMAGNVHLCAADVARTGTEIDFAKIPDVRIFKGDETIGYRDPAAWYEDKSPAGSVPTRISTQRSQRLLGVFAFFAQITFAFSAFRNLLREVSPQGSLDVSLHPLHNFPKIAP